MLVTTYLLSLDRKYIKSKLDHAMIECGLLVGDDAVHSWSA